MVKLSVENPEVEIASKIEPNSDTATTIPRNYWKRNERLKSRNEKSKNLNLLYMLLQSISPTSAALASERVFSNSNDFMTQKWSNLSD